MGYDIHVTRKEAWHYEGGAPISEEEWFSLIQEDTDLRLDGEATANLPNGSELTAIDPTIAVWTAYSKHDDKGNMAWLQLSAGNVTVKNPDREILIKLHQIAEKLGAQVQGDEEEHYDANGNVSFTSESTEPKTKSWFKFW